MDERKIVSRAEWLVARKALLEEEKKVTYARDQINLAREALPMVDITDEDYKFQGPDGELTMLDLFEGRRQLIVRHVMFAAGATEGCMGCSMQADSVGDLRHMWARDTTFVMVSIAPYADYQPFKARMGWDIPWVSSEGTTFNRDYEVSSDLGESPGVSAFYTEGGRVFHTYSIYDRGGDIFKAFYNYLDITHLGRQERELEHPWDWWRFKDQYEATDAVGPGTNHWNGTRFAS